MRVVLNRLFHQSIIWVDPYAGEWAEYIYSDDGAAGWAMFPAIPDEQGFISGGTYYV